MAMINRSDYPFKLIDQIEIIFINTGTMANGGVWGILSMERKNGTFIFRCSAKLVLKQEGR